MPTIRWPWAGDEPPPVQKADGIFTKLQKKLETFQAPVLAITAFTLGSVTTVTAALAYTRYGRRLRNGDWITPDVFAKKRWIRGAVTAVGDADNFRLYHTPSLGWNWPVKLRCIPSNSKDLKDQTLHIRIAGVDAPEGAHFGRPGQPYAAESLAWLRNTILGKTVYCQLLRRDQYSRVVAIVVLPPRFLPRALVSGKNLSLEMLRAGWVTTYEQAGAEYGTPGKDEFLRIEAEAKAAKRGMWKKGVHAETPLQYKRRYANTASLEQAAADETKTRQRGSPRSWFSRLFSL